MNKPTQAQIDKLPKWAVKHIENLERERDTSIHALNEYIDSQTHSAFSVEDGVCTGEEHGPSIKTRYIQTEKMFVEHAGILLSVWTIHEDHIALQWEDSNRLACEVAVVPQSYQRIHLVSRDNMRHK